MTLRRSPRPLLSGLMIRGSVTKTAETALTALRRPGVVEKGGQLLAVLLNP